MASWRICLLCWTDRLMCTYMAWRLVLADAFAARRNDRYASPFVSSKQPTIDLVLQTLWSVPLLFNSRPTGLLQPL